MRYAAPSLALLFSILTFLYSAERIRRTRSLYPKFSTAGLALWENATSVHYSSSTLLESLVATILVFRGVGGLIWAPMAARRIEDQWVLSAYIAVGLAHIIALLTVHLFGRWFACTLQFVIWTTLSVMLYYIDQEVTAAFPVFAAYMAWISVRLYGDLTHRRR